VSRAVCPQSVGSPRARSPSANYTSESPQKLASHPRIDTQVRVYSERRAGTQCRIARARAHTCARSTGPVACVVLTFTRMRTDQPLRRTVDGGLTHRRGSHEDHKDPDPPRIPHPSDPARDMCARVLRNADVGDDPAKSTSYLTSEHITFKPTHIEFTHAAFTTWILCAPRPIFNPVVP
jgi:hypothetical protein